MHPQAFIWLFLPLLVAGGSALVAYYLMQARMDTALAKERESLAEARAQLQSHKISMEERIKATEEATRRAALDEMMRDIRIEERSYIRDTNTLDGARRSLILQERVYFRNIPMSGWTEREMLIELAAPNELSARQDKSPIPSLSPGVPSQLVCLSREVQTASIKTPQLVPSTPQHRPVVTMPIAFGAQ